MALKLSPLLPGKTYSFGFQLWNRVWVYKPITAISQGAPVVITCAAHGMPADWPHRISSVQGMDEINTVSHDDGETQLLLALKDDGFRRATIIDANSFSINTVNAALYDPYTSSGFVEYPQPFTIPVGATARAKARESQDSATVLLDMTTANGKLILDNTAHTLYINLSPADTAPIGTLGLDSMVVDFEIVQTDGVVIAADFNRKPLVWKISREVTY